MATVSTFCEKRQERSLRKGVRRRMGDGPSLGSTSCLHSGRGTSMCHLVHPPCDDGLSRLGVRISGLSDGCQTRDCPYPLLNLSEARAPTSEDHGRAPQTCGAAGRNQNKDPATQCYCPAPCQRQHPESRGKAVSAWGCGPSGTWMCHDPSKGRTPARGMDHTPVRWRTPSGARALALSSGPAGNGRMPPCRPSPARLNPAPQPARRCARCARSARGIRPRRCPSARP